MSYKLQMLSPSPQQGETQNPLYHAIHSKSKIVMGYAAPSDRGIPPHNLVAIEFNYKVK